MEIRPLSTRLPRSDPLPSSPSHLLYIAALGVTVDMSAVLRNLNRHRPQPVRLSSRDYNARCYRQPGWFDARAASGLYEDRSQERRPQSTGAVFCPPIDAQGATRNGFSARPLPKAAQVFRRRRTVSAAARPPSRPPTAASSNSRPHPSLANSPRGTEAVTRPCKTPVPGFRFSPS